MGYDASLISNEGINSNEFNKYIKNKYDKVDIKLLENFGSTSMSYSYFIQLDKYVSCNTEFIMYVSKEEYEDNRIKEINIRAQIWVNDFVCNVVYNLINELVTKFDFEIK